MSESCLDFCKNSKVADLFQTPGPELITINKQTTIAECLEVLRKNKILSVPVVDENNAILGVVDIYEIVSVCTIAISPVALIA